MPVFCLSLAVLYYTRYGCIGKANDKAYSHGVSYMYKLDTGCFVQQLLIYCLRHCRIPATMAETLIPEALTKTSLSEADNVFNTNLVRALRDSIPTTIEFTVRDPKHETEKPYALRYDTEGAIPNTNVVNEAKSVTIKNFRAVQSSSNYGNYGFCVEKLDEPLTEGIFEEKGTIRDTCYPLIEKILRRRWPEAKAVYILEHNLRKRHAQFPTLQQGLQIEYTQPARLVHIDSSLDSAVRTAQSAFSIPADQCRRVVSINFWKSLQGPGNDWPLALCDERTLNHALDTVIADVVYHNRYTENEFVYYNEKQEWWYVSDLKDDEIIMFVQKDSESEIEGGGGQYRLFRRENFDFDEACRSCAHEFP